MFLLSNSNLIRTKESRSFQILGPWCPEPRQVCSAKSGRNPKSGKIILGSWTDLFQASLPVENGPPATESLILWVWRLQGEKPAWGEAPKPRGEATNLRSSLITLGKFLYLSVSVFHLQNGATKSIYLRGVCKRIRWIGICKMLWTVPHTNCLLNKVNSSPLWPYQTKKKIMYLRALGYIDVCIYFCIFVSKISVREAERKFFLFCLCSW